MQDRKKYEGDTTTTYKGNPAEGRRGLAQKRRGRMGPNINRVETHASLARWTRNADQYTAIMHRTRRNITVIRRGFAFFVVPEHFLFANVNLKNVPRISFETHVHVSSTSRNSHTRFYILHFFFKKQSKWTKSQSNRKINKFDRSS